MPGHIKLVKGAVDPDPTEFLLPSIEMKRADQQKPYDSKKSVWIPDEKTGGYKEGLIESGDLEDPASKCVVAVGHEKFTLKSTVVGKVNPPKFEKCEDMVNLTFLNDASVFWNLKTRYQAKMIHTYSGLFVVVVNPYKRYPIYTHRVCKIYLGKRRNEVPPHLWAIAETAYRNMLQNKKDNAMYSPFFGVMGATSAMVFSAMGAAYGTAKSGTGIAAMAVMRPEAIMKSIIPVVMAGIVAIYGVVVAVLIAGQLEPAGDKYTLYKGFVHLGAGLSVGLSGLAAGYAIGIVGDAGVRGTAQQPRLFVGMILILIFAEVLGLYGLIVAIFLYAKK